MPLPLLPLIGIGANLLGQGINAAATAKANKQQREFELQMFNMSRNNALADREFENSYNSPAAQMERFRAAGLNPNLIYGQGTQASQSVHTAQTQPGHYKPQAPQFDIGGAFNQFISQIMANQSLQAQTDNLKAQTELTRLKQDTEYLNQNQVVQNTEQSRIKGEILLETKEAQIAAADLKNKKAVADIAFTTDQNMRAAAMSSQNVAESVERMLKLRAERENMLPAQLAIMKQQLQNMVTDGRMKEVQARLWEAGINPHNPAWVTILGSLATDVWNESQKKLLASPGAEGIQQFLDSKKKQ